MAPRLSCERCQQRKVKCDKLDPCRSCQRDGALCVPVERLRLPRGRGRPKSTLSCLSRGGNLELAQKITRMERLVEAMTTANSETSLFGSLSIGELGKDIPPKDSSDDYSEGATFQSDLGIFEIGSLAGSERSYPKSSLQKVDTFALWS